MGTAFDRQNLYAPFTRRVPRLRGRRVSLPTLLSEEASREVTMTDRDQSVAT